MLCLDCSLRKEISLQIIDLFICKTFAISDWLRPLLDSSNTWERRHSICCNLEFKSCTGLHSISAGVAFT